MSYIIFCVIFVVCLILRVVYNRNTNVIERMSLNDYNHILSSINANLKCKEHVYYVHSICEKSKQINVFTLHKPSLSVRSYVVTYDPNTFKVRKTKSTVGDKFGHESLYNHTGLKK